MVDLSGVCLCVAGVPRVWEKISEKMRAIGASIEGVKKKISTWAKAKGLEHARACEVGGDGSYPSMYGLAVTLVLSKVKENLGESNVSALGQCRDVVLEGLRVLAECFRS